MTQVRFNDGSAQAEPSVNWDQQQQEQHGALGSKAKRAASLQDSTLGQALPSGFFDMGDSERPAAKKVKTNDDFSVFMKEVNALGQSGEHGQVSGSGSGQTANEGRADDEAVREASPPIQEEASERDGELEEFEQL